MSASSEGARASDDVVRRCLLAAREPDAFVRKWRAASEDFLGSARILGAEIVQTYYVPDKLGRLFLRARIARRDDHRRKRYLSLQVYDSPEQALRRAAAAARGKRPLRSTGAPYFVVPEWNAMVWELPNGPRLRGLRTFMQRKALRRFLERAGLESLAEPELRRPRLIRYVPRRRAVFRWKYGTGGKRRIFIKVHAPGRDDRAAENLRVLSRAASELGPLAVPELIHYEPSRRAVLMSGLPGVQFTDLVHEATDEQCRAIAAGLAALHSSGLDLPRSWGPRDQFQALTRAMRDVRRALPASARRLDDLVSELGDEVDRLGAWSPRPIHGNLFGDQILLDGDRVGLVDWDDLTAGDPAFDVARLIAHVLYVTGFERPEVGERVGRTILEAYEREVGATLSGRRLRFYLTGALLLRAKIDGLRKLPKGWEERVVWAIGRAERALRSDG